ncbi:MAG: CoA transferase [Lachnospiraceae bacterium]|nr:CoA transferase [Lachnospiraceae bacterium]
MNKMLEGVKVLDMCVAAAGPSCSRILVDFGATDIMVEPMEGQSTRITAPHSYDFKCGGKKSIPINLKSEEGMAVFKKLVQWADVFVSNFRAKALKKLGLTYEDLSQINPRLIHATISGFGEVGAQKDDAGFDATAWWAKSGMLVDIAQPDSIVNIPYATGDFSAGHALATGICAALYNREKTGKGEKVTTSLMASGIYLNYHAIIESQYGLELPTSRKTPERSLLNTYKAGDGKWFSMNATHHWDVTWPTICNFIGRPDLIDKYTYEDTCWDGAPEVTAMLDEAFSKHTREEIYEAFKACGTISIENASHSIDVASDQQAIDNEFVVPYKDREGKELMHPTTPIRFGDYHAPEMPYGPKLGEHTVEILQMLGYSDDEIKDYESRDIVKVLHE